jgi:SulP family sulfate permease
MLGMLLSLGLYLRRTSRPAVLPRVPDPNSPRRKFVTVHADLPECPQLRIVRVDGSLYFGATGHLEEQLAASSAQAHLAIVGDGINFIDIDAAELLANEAERRRAAGGGLHFIRLKREAREFLRRGGYLDRIGDASLFVAKSEAIAAIHGRLDPQRCAGCSLRIFNECHGVARPDTALPADVALAGA